TANGVTTRSTITTTTAEVVAVIRTSTSTRTRKRTSTRAATEREARAAGRSGSTTPSTAAACLTGTRPPRRSMAAGIRWRLATARIGTWRAASTAGSPAGHVPPSSPPGEAPRRRPRGLGRVRGKVAGGRRHQAVSLAGKAGSDRVPRSSRRRVLVGQVRDRTGAKAAPRALGAATRGNGPGRLARVLGPGSEEIVSSGDPVDDAAARKRFATAAAERTRIERTSDAIAILHVGRDDWPFPIPIVRDADGWRFDTAAGKEELLNRRIGRNELTAIEVCRAYVDAQIEFARRLHTHAQSFRSTPGKRDGVHWEATDHDVSPLGPRVAAATAEDYRYGEAGQAPAPYHGYFFRILTAQGAHAPDGARDYVKDGRMTGGFALVAWPADHGSSGIMTLIVGEQGVVFQKDLGEGTGEAAKAITAYDPDESWQPTR